MSAFAPASDWIAAHLPRAMSTQGDAQGISRGADTPWLVDWACGRGRHSVLALERGWNVLALDRDAEALNDLLKSAEQLGTAAALRTIRADLEEPRHPWDWAQRLRRAASQLPRTETGSGQGNAGPPDDEAPWALGAIVMTRYLHRASWFMLANLLAPGGWLLHETFALGHAKYGRPTRAAFLLQPGELLALAQRANLAVLAFQDGTLEDEAGQAFARVQRLVARKPANNASLDPWDSFRLRSAV